MLISIEQREDLGSVALRPSELPLRFGERSSFKQFVQRLRVDIERGEFPSVSLDDVDDGVGNFLSLLPMFVKPLLKDRDLTSTLYLNIELNVLRQAGFGEVT